MTLAPGTTVGRYQILEPLGQGGMATVYKAFQPSLQREVALKVLRPGYSQDQEFRERFEREAIAIAKLRHPHIVQVFDFEVAQSGEYVLAMEFLEGGTLKERVTHLAHQGSGLDPAESVRIIGEVAEALGYAHEKGIVHRDVKPANVMLTQKDWAVVTDFGIARILGSTSHTQTGVGIGTPEYMAPEQGQGGAIDHRADIYSLGAMAYELLTGRVPYSADTPLAIVIAHIKDPLPLPSKVNPGIGVGVERALLRALAKDPAQRFESATSFADALKAGLVEDRKGRTLPTVVVRGAVPASAATSAPAAPKQVTLSIPPFLAQRPIVAGVAAGLVLALVVVGVVVGNALRGAPQASSGPTAGPAQVTPSAVAAVGPQALSGLSFAAMRGAFLYEVKLDDRPGEITVNGTTGFAKVQAGLLEITAPEAQQQVEAAFNAQGVPRGVPYAVEMRVAFVQGATMRFAFCFRQGGQAGSYCLTMLARGGIDASVELRYTDARGMVDRVGDPFQIQLSQPFQLAVVVDKNVFTVFVNDRAVMQKGDDRLGETNNTPVVQAARLGSNPDNTGTVHLSSVRFYRLAGR